MIANRYSKPLMFVFGGLSALLVVLSLHFARQCELLKANVRLANDIVWSYKATRDEALAKDPEKAADCLERIYLPPGMEAFSGPAGPIVERERIDAMRQIIAHLRKLTGRELGEDPLKWIEGLRTKTGTSAPITEQGVAN